MNTEHEGPRPRALFAWMLLAVALFLAIGTFTVVLIAENANDAERACERSVGFRDDARAMWLAVFEMFPDAESVDELQAKLNELLPRLHCDDDNHPVPVDE